MKGNWARGETTAKEGGWVDVGVCVCVCGGGGGAMGGEGERKGEKTAPGNKLCKSSSTAADWASNKVN